MAFCDLLYHLVFSTKNREPDLSDEVMERLVPYLGGILRNLGGHALAINGTRDHVHIAMVLPPTAAPSRAVGAIKANSSRWIGETWPQSSFLWQKGYGIFTMSYSHREALLRYIRGQQEHHQTTSFEEEFVDLLRRHGVEYDPRYLWG